MSDFDSTLRELGGPGLRLVVAAELEAAVRSMGLCEPGQLQALVDRHPGGRGRGRTAIVPIPGEGRRLHLRPMLRGGLLGPWLGARIANLSGPLRELRTTARLHAAGAPVPAPALVVGRRVGLHWEAMLATIHEEGTSDGADFLASAPDPERILAAARAAARSIRMLHDGGLVHGDLHVGNLLVREDSSATTVIVIDLAGARVGRPPGAGVRMREIMRLRRSLAKRGLDRIAGGRAEVAFFAAYTDGDRMLRDALLARRGREILRTRVHRLAWRAP